MGNIVDCCLREDDKESKEELTRGWSADSSLEQPQAAKQDQTVNDVVTSNEAAQPQATERPATTSSTKAIRVGPPKAYRDMNASHPTGVYDGSILGEEYFFELYDMGEAIGVGSTSTCYACKRRKDGRHFAVKVIDKRDMEIKFSGLLEQFYVEIKVLQCSNTRISYFLKVSLRVMILYILYWSA